MNKRILKLAVPNIISNITVPLLGMVDLGLVGHLGSPVFMGAIGLGTTIFNILYWAMAFLRVSTVGLTAQEYGKKRFDESSLIFGRAIFIAIFFGILIIILLGPLSALLFRIIKGSAEVEFYAKQYFCIRLIAAPVTIGLFVLFGWFIGIQNT